MLPMVKWWMYNALVWHCCNVHTHKRRLGFMQEHQVSQYVERQSGRWHLKKTKKKTTAFNFGSCSKLLSPGVLPLYSVVNVVCFSILVSHFTKNKRSQGRKSKIYDQGEETLLTKMTPKSDSMGVRFEANSVVSKTNLTTTIGLVVNFWVGTKVFTWVG